MRFSKSDSIATNPSCITSKSRMSEKLLIEIIRRTDGERILSVHPESNKRHSNSFQKITRFLFSFNNCMIQPQQIQDVYASRSRIVGQFILTEIIRRTDGEQFLSIILNQISHKQHSNSFQKTTRILFSFNNCTIQPQQIQDVNASKSRIVGKLLI